MTNYDYDRMNKLDILRMAASALHIQGGPSKKKDDVWLAMVAIKHDQTDFTVLAKGFDEESCLFEAVRSAAYYTLFGPPSPENPDAHGHTECFNTAKDALSWAVNDIKKREGL